MVSMAPMAISLIWPLWRYGHSCHRGHSSSRPPIWVSKEASGPQDCSLWSQFCLNDTFKGQKLKIHAEIIFLYNFVEKGSSTAHTKQSRSKENGNQFRAYLKSNYWFYDPVAYKWRVEFLFPLQILINLVLFNSVLIDLILISFILPFWFWSI